MTHSRVAHWEELRARLTRTAAVFMLCLAGAVPSGNVVRDILLAPAGALVFTGPADAFAAWAQAVFLLAVLALVPFALYEGGAFVAAGLLPSERRAVLYYGCWMLGLFFGGCLFAWFVVLPVTLAFFLSFAAPGLAPMIAVDRYFAFAGGLVLGMGGAFQLPLVMKALVRFRLLPAGAFRRGRRFAVVFVLVVAAVLTPPDVFSQLMLAVPLMALYELGVWWCGRGQ